VDANEVPWKLNMHFVNYSPRRALNSGSPRFTPLSVLPQDSSPRTCTYAPIAITAGGDEYCYFVGPAPLNIPGLQVSPEKADKRLSALAMHRQGATELPAGDDRETGGSDEGLSPSTAARCAAKQLFVDHFLLPPCPSLPPPLRLASISPLSASLPPSPRMLPPTSSLAPSRHRHSSPSPCPSFSPPLSTHALSRLNRARSKSTAKSRLLLDSNQSSGAMGSAEDCTKPWSAREGESQNDPRDATASLNQSCVQS
jgi:hypothetical protein